MARLKIVQKKSKLMPLLPHKLLINGRMVGLMQQAEVAVEMPAGEYRITIQSMIPILSATRTVVVDEGLENVLTFTDREKWWDALFVIDIVMSIAKFFFDLPAPWDLVYKIFTNGYFVLWLVYEWVIRKRYFRLEFAQYARRLTDEAPKEEPLPSGCEDR